MLSKFILICYLFIMLSSKKKEAIYLPLDKDSTYGEDICKIYKDGYNYVRPCNKGYYCLDDRVNSLGICQEMEKNPYPMKDFDEKCSNDNECMNNWVCDNGKCACRNSISSVCTSCFIHRSGLACQSKSNTQKSSSHCQEASYTTSGSSPITYSFTYSYLPYSSDLKNQICGKLTLDDLSGSTNYYYVKYIDYAYIGTVDDGDFVTNQKLCKSGYAIDYDTSGKSLYSGYSGTVNVLQCITPISLDTEKDYLKYELKGEEYNKINFNHQYENNIKIKSERYREYVTKLNEDNELKEKCGNLDGESYYTCENVELIKLWYFYKYPEDYLIYNGREGLEKVLAYFIQKKYPNYSSGYFNNIMLLQILLLLIILF